MEELNSGMIDFWEHWCDTVSYDWTSYRKPLFLVLMEKHTIGVMMGKAQAEPGLQMYFVHNNSWTKDSCSLQPTQAVTAIIE